MQKFNETNPIHKAAKGSIIILLGTILSTLFVFIYRLLFARYFESIEYGIFSLSVTILSILTIIGTMGLNEGLSRQISFYIGRNKKKNIRTIIRVSLIYGLLFSSVISIILYLFSEFFSSLLFHDQNFTYVIKIIALTIPFYVEISILNSIFRGYQRVKENVIFIDILKNLLFIIFLLIIIYYRLSLMWAIISYSFTFILTLTFFIFYYLRNKPYDYQYFTKKSTIGRELLFFSIPIMFVSILNQIVVWTDTLMLGIFKTASIVGLYNAALPIGRFVSIPLGALLFIYTPIASELFSKKNDNEMRRTYLVLSKWLSSMTFPIAMMFILFPNYIIFYSFGQEYIGASIALQILATGFFINNLMGPNGATLMAMGKTKFLMYSTFGSACINISLNYILIPSFGIIGAAISSAIALISMNFIRSIQLYKLTTITSIGKNTIKPILFSLIAFLIINYLFKSYISINLIIIIIIFTIYVLIYIISLVITKSIDFEDIDLLLKVESKTGFNLIRIKRFIQKFI